MKFKDKLKLTLLKKFLLKSSDWEITDNIIIVEEELNNSSSSFLKSFLNKNDNDNYICLKNYNGISIFIEEKYKEDFKNLSNIFDKDLKMINLTKLLTYKNNEYIQSFISHKITPASVKISFIYFCIVESIPVYVCYIIDLDQKQKLYSDLYSYKVISDSYHL